MTSPGPAHSGGSRTAAYLIAGALATAPAGSFAWALFGLPLALGGVVVLWASGIVWLLRKRQEDPMWDRRPASGRR